MIAYHQSLEDWPDHMRQVFAAIGRAMNGKRLSPEIVATMGAADLLAISGHRVTIDHVSASELGAKRGRYTVTISGARIDGRWHFQSGVLEKLASEAGK